MAGTDDSLGGRLRLLDVHELDPVQGETYALINQSIVPMASKAGFKSRLDDGRLIGPFNPFLVSPAIGAAYLRMTAIDAKESALGERVRQVVILTVGAVCKAPYELYAHRAVGRAAGLSEHALGALEAGQPSSELTANEEIARRFALQLSAEQCVEQSLYEQARDAFGERALVDLTFLVGSYLFTSAVLNAFTIPAPLG